MWAQTEAHVYVAVHVPTGYASKALDVAVTAAVLIVDFFFCV